MRNIYKDDDFNEKYEKDDDVFVDLRRDRNSTSKAIGAFVVIIIAMAVFAFCKYVLMNYTPVNNYEPQNIENRLSQNGESTRGAINGEFDLYSVDEVFIDVDCANLEVEKSESSDTIKLEVFAEDDDSLDAYYNCDEYGWGTLNVISTGENYGWDLNEKAPVIKLFIPETYGGQFYINLPYGEVNIGNFKYSSISLMSDAGDVSIEEAENISANLSYGDLEIGKVRTIYALCNAGDIEIGEVDSFCNLEVELGNIEIENCNIDSESDLHIDCGDIKIDKTSDVNIEASTSFGDTRVAHSNASSPVKLTAIVDAGDIKIN